MSTSDNDQPLPIRLQEVNDISTLYGERDTADTVKAESYGLRMWPKFSTTANHPTIWRISLDKSPGLMKRFHCSDREELKKFLKVGLLFKEDMVTISPSQALILGYVERATHHG